MQAPAVGDGCHLVGDSPPADAAFGPMKGRRPMPSGDDDDRHDQRGVDQVFAWDRARLA